MADLTYVATQEGWLYLAGIKDVYTCEIVGYAMGERMTKELTGKALFMALRSQRPPAGLIHHSERGSQYCAYDYRVIQEQFGLKTSMSRKGNCYDNAPMESFWGTLGDLTAMLISLLLVNNGRLTIIRLLMHNSGFFMFVHFRK